MVRFHLRKLSDAEVREQHEVKISNRFAALANLDDDDDDMDISRAWEGIGGNIKSSATDSLGYYELKQHKPWFDEECSKLLDQRKQAKLQWLKNSGQTKGDILNNVRRDTNRVFRNKKREYLKEINELETYSKYKGIRDI